MASLVAQRLKKNYSALNTFKMRIYTLNILKYFNKYY